MSSINPNNIDGTYPIAGQDNDSQGFRDNFTNIKNNFNFAAAEVADLQTNSILKSALSGTTLDNNMNNAQLKGAQIIKFTETKTDLGQQGGATTVTVNWSDGHFQTLETTGVVTLAFANWPTSGFWTSFKLEVDVTSVAHTLTLPASVTENLTRIQGAVGQVITFPAAGKYLFEFSTYDGGTTVAIRDLLRNYDSTEVSSTYTTITVSTLANITANTTSTSTTTGALKVAGGVGVVENLNVGGATAIAGNVTLGGAVVVTGYQYSNTSTTGGNITVSANVSRLVLDPAAGFDGFNIILPAGNINAKTIQISSTETIANLLVNGNTGTTVKPAANISLTAGTSVEYFFQASENKWYKTR